MSRHPLGCFSFFFLCPYSYYFAYFQEIIGIITKYTWTLPGSCSRRRIAVATFARLSTTISCMDDMFPHNVPLFEGCRRCCWYACMLLKGLLHLGFLQTIPTTLEWLDCMMMIWTNKYSTLRVKINLILSVFSDHYDDDVAK